MSSQLKTKFEELVSKYTDDKKIVELYWLEIEQSYTAKKRFYHDLTHLENMIAELQMVKESIADFDSILFSVFYHDIVSKSTAKDNEEKSAELAKDRLQKLNVPMGQIELVYRQILATKSHQPSENQDTNFLLDADLSILGKDWSQYKEYIGQIRKEYAIYPDFMYNPGRKKVLKHFLEFDVIFKTDYFKNQYENQARENLKKEIDLL